MNPAYGGPSLSLLFWGSLLLSSFPQIQLVCRSSSDWSGHHHEVESKVSSKAVLWVSPRSCWLTVEYPGLGAELRFSELSCELGGQPFWRDPWEEVSGLSSLWSFYEASCIVWRYFTWPPPNISPVPRDTPGFMKLQHPHHVIFLSEGLFKAMLHFLNYKHTS